MSLYIKTPVAVHAVQYTMTTYDEVIIFVGDEGGPTIVNKNAIGMEIRNKTTQIESEGEDGSPQPTNYPIAHLGDWIVRENGALHVVKNEAFEKDYKKKSKPRVKKALADPNSPAPEKKPRAPRKSK